MRFFTPLSEEYRIVIRYFADEKKYLVKADDNFGGGASFEFYVDRDEHIDGWHSDEAVTVEEYFTKAYNDPAIDDIYHYSIKLMERFLGDTFGLSIDELYALHIR
ncbi:MAG: hypothetical protein GX115_14035 [Ruminiclostridium sp.]|nr:hypothetical protein [Ruminiclostridium sp.]